MALTPSSMSLPIGAAAPDFKLIDVVSNKVHSLQNLKSNIATVVMFICNHCPYVLHIQDKLISVAQYYIEKGISFIAINSNDPISHPADAPDKMRLVAQQKSYPFPYLFDESQAIAKAYHAACTPDFFVFDKNLTCVYRGRFDDASPGNNVVVTGKDLCAALDALLANTPVSSAQKASIGCNIKWRSQ